jgi:ribonuclease HI
MDLRPHHLLGLSFREAILVIVQDMPADATLQCLSLLWHIWKNRYTFLFEKRPINPYHPMAVSAASLENMALLLKLKLTTTVPATTTAVAAVSSSQDNNLESEYRCSLDGSFTSPDEGGAAFVVSKRGILVQYGVYHSVATSPFQMEAMALLRSVQLTETLKVIDCTFHTDSQLLVQHLAQTGSTQGADWRAYTSLTLIAKILARNSGYKLVYQRWEDNNQAYTLANWARISNLSNLPAYLTYLDFTDSATVAGLQ